MKPPGTRVAHTSQVSAGRARLFRKSYSDRIGDEKHHDGYLGGRFLYGAGRLRSNGDNEIGFRSHEIGSERRQLIELRTSFLAVNCHGGTLDPAELTKLVG